MENVEVDGKVEPLGSESVVMAPPELSTRHKKNRKESVWLKDYVSHLVTAVVNHFHPG